VAGATVLGRLSGSGAPLVWRLAEVVELVPETPTVTSLVLDVPEWPGHRSGQHVDVRLTAEDGYQAQRSYSIASAPEDGRLVLTIERLEDGEVSPYLVGELRPGDRFELRGPIGGYFVWDAGEDGVLNLLAGGSGVVPLMAMLRHRAAAGSELPARLLYSVRSLEEVIYREELERRAAGGDGLEVTYTLTRVQPLAWTGYARRIDEAMLGEVFGQAGDGGFYVCGPTSFVETAASALVSIGHDPSRIRTERFGPTGG
jgi:ferredoxin-NADP reductase